MNMLARVRDGEWGMLVLGNHPAIIQSMLDFDFLSGKKRPSVLGVVTGNRKAQKFFWGQGELLIPCFADLSRVPRSVAEEVRFMLNVQSGRRAYESTLRFFEVFPQALGGSIFAENVPEGHATALIKHFGGKYFILGPASVGLLVPGALKLGAVGGVDLSQIRQGKLTEAGGVAVASTSGGMTNELITAVVKAGKRVSFAAGVGGDRFPVASLTDVFLLAEKDLGTKGVAYFGELGGVDEYEIAELIRQKKFTKPLVAYIAGVIDEAFDEHVQFGHAKALVTTKDESARAKREALRAAGVIAPDTFPEFEEALAKFPGESDSSKAIPMSDLTNRKKSILSTREIADPQEVPVFVRGKKLLKQKTAFTTSILTALLGKEPRSPITVAFAEAVFRLLIDHGGQVSGAVNTMITARAGRDLVTSLSSGLLTVGPRFGGAVNAAALAWLEGAAGKAGKESAADFVERKTKGGNLILGIGHLKYRVGLPDPRVAALLQFTTLLKKHSYLDFARAVEKVTTGKNGTLILNIDGAIAALMLDILAECEGLSREELRELADAEFFNAFFVIPRSVGFIAHFLEQKKNDEGLFRLPDELLFVRKEEKNAKKGKRSGRK